MTPAQDRELAETITQIGEAFAAKTEHLEAKVDQLERAVGRVGAQGPGMVTNMATGITRPMGTTKSMVVENPEHTKAFDAWARSGEGVDNLRKIENSMSTLSDPSGGYLVPTELDTEIDGVVGDAVAMRRLATVKGRKKGQYKRPFDTGGIDAGWVSEMESRPDTDASELALFAPAWAEMYASPSCTQALLDDADFDLSGWLSSSISTKFSEFEGTGFISGTGVGQPRGIATYTMVDAASWEHGKVGYVTSGSAASLTADSIVDLQHSLKPVYRRNGTWLMSDTTWAVIRKLKDGEGNYLWAPGLMEAAPDTLLGRPVEIDDNLDAIGAGNFPIAFADFKRAYIILDHAAGVRTLRDPFSVRGRVSFYTTAKVTGGIYNYQAIRFLKISA